MTPSDIISNYRQISGDKASPELARFFAFTPMVNENNELFDSNLAFRTTFVEQLLHDFSATDVELVRDLFSEEMKCERRTRRHDNLYQLCYYLFAIGELEDIFILYDAKFNTRNMDVDCMLDREMITAGRNIDEVIHFIEEEFKQKPELGHRYSGILKELNDLKKFPDYDHIESYSTFIRGYFLGHDELRVYQIKKRNPGGDFGRCHNDHKAINEEQKSYSRSE